ncbi:MAG: hypothetical protein JRG91_20805 [Deltaproteobacteria bacterium]|nr:hypothetical protein [Deltaproteobacteria bacterium]
MRVRGCVTSVVIALAIVWTSDVTTSAGTRLQDPAGVTPEAVERTWIGPDGQPLPFRSDAEAIVFLSKARVVSKTTIGVGVNRAQQVLLERGGVRAHAIFREVDIERDRTRVGPRFYFKFRDSYRHECAAYALALQLGLDNIPPVVSRTIDRQPGSLQLWVEDTRDETTRAFTPPDARAWVQQIWAMHLFDNLIFNVDRNAGNMLVGHDYELWMIDHTRGFQIQRELLAPEKVVRVNRLTWERLLGLTEEALEPTLGEHITGGQIRAILARRDRLVERVEGLVAKAGDAAVFY